jgi:hypothetical protein
MRISEGSSEENGRSIAPAPGLRSRLLLGALAGLAGTAAMTAAMSRLHRRLPADEQYPLPPREITEVVAGSQTNEALKDEAMAAHFAFGAGAGALVAVVRPAPTALTGAVAGVGVWAASYFGWAPALGILKPADKHPARRNALMVGVHLIWGAVTAATLRELTVARVTMLRAGPLRDATKDTRDTDEGNSDPG